MNYILKKATISDCQRYRYTLTRVWDNTLQRVLFIGLNPSTADADKDDAAIRKLTKYCQTWGYGGFTIVNLFALRSRNPFVLLNHSRKECQGPENLKHIIELVAYPDGPAKIICMWGDKGDLYEQDRIVLDRLKGLKLHCFDISKRGLPKHPLYLSSSLKPIEYVTK